MSILSEIDYKTMNDLFLEEKPVDVEAMLTDLRTWWNVAPKWERETINVTGKALRHGLTETLQRRYDAHKRRFVNNQYDK